MKNWDYEYFPRHAMPHGITFNRCRDSGIHEYKYSPATNVTCWRMREEVRGWLNEVVGSDHWTSDDLVPYAVNFSNKQDAMLFKLVMSA